MRGTCGGMCWNCRKPGRRSFRSRRLDVSHRDTEQLFLRGIHLSRVNDFAFKIATANGTGSASANGLIMQAIFRMGVPVTGKNVFPSNIHGLPTWYEIRVSGRGYTARTATFDLMVALNEANYSKD